ncbi:P-loop NTPase family protein [Parerythrobacter jejuensis]|uniref:ATPase n=1 Tax=Parerythrobacter jejuensis TaxID=795812 RepID=A0A845ARE0_9SPHN|nr:ATPase [Parerythrobacter jejuensis]MXP32880.1 ATPase [Parerythrobacter jejuensis]
MSQIALPLAQGLPADPASIVVGNANAHVAEALADPSNWPFGTAILMGPARAGKSLLARWFEGAGKGSAIDGADNWDETELFHRWNRAREQDEALLLVADGDRWDITLPDLKSRLGAALHLEIGTPDDAMLADLIQSHATRRGLALGEGALTYLVPRATRSFADIEKLVAMIDRLTLERKAAPTQGIWRDALEAVQGPEQARLL